MRKLLVTLLAFLCMSGLQAGNYKSFKISVYTRAYEVEKMKDLHYLEHHFQPSQSRQDLSGDPQRLAHCPRRDNRTG